MGKYLEMIDDEDREMTREELIEAQVELAQDLFGVEAARELAIRLNSEPKP